MIADLSLYNRFECKFVYKKEAVFQKLFIFGYNIVENENCSVVKKDFCCNIFFNIIRNDNVQEDTNPELFSHWLFN